MTPEELEKNINDPNSVIFTDPILATVEKKEYPFFREYLDANTTPERVRENVIIVLRAINQDWCFKYFLIFLRDRSYAIRMMAADGMAFLETGVDPGILIQEIQRLNSEKHESRDKVVKPLVLAIGNSRDNAALIPLLELKRHEAASEPGVESRDSDILIAYQKASAKLGYQKTIREIELELVSGDGYKKYSALNKVVYLDDASWIEKVVPMLLDEEIGWSIPMGPHRITRRVCDHAAFTLKKIDPVIGARIPDKSTMQKYADEEILQIRNEYGLPKR